MATMQAAAAAEVSRSAREADLLVLRGSGATAGTSRARGIWRWPGGEGTPGGLQGDWYLTAAAASPLAGAFVGLPVDSFPPAVQIVPTEPPADAWVALRAQLARRGAERAVVFGRDSGNRRELTVTADGLWRWAFRGGASGQAYRALAGSAVSWLLGGADSARGRARAVRRVVPNRRPVVFEWLGGGTPAPLPIALDGPGGARTDTLRFAGDGRAQLRLEPGVYTYRLQGGGNGTVAVEEYSDEWLPQPITLTPGEGTLAAPAGHTRARNWPWLFGLCILGPGGGMVAAAEVGAAIGQRAESREQREGRLATPSPVSRLPSPVSRLPSYVLPSICLPFRPMALGRLKDKESLWTRIKRLATTNVGALVRQLSASDLEDIERVLIEADFGVPATMDLVQAVEEEIRKGKVKTDADLRSSMISHVAALLEDGAEPGRLGPRGERTDRGARRRGERNREDDDGRQAGGAAPPGGARTYSWPRRTPTGPGPSSSWRNGAGGWSCPA